MSSWRPRRFTLRQPTPQEDAHHDHGLHRREHVDRRIHLGPGETGFEHLFQWYGNGDIEVPTGDPNMTLRMSQVSADHWREVLELTGALVVGRKLFDAMGGWGGKHPADKPVVVLTHREAPEGWE